MIKRILRNIFTTEFALWRRFPKQALADIERLIKASERTHSGQIRFAVEGWLPVHRIIRGLSVRERAVEIFTRLRVWDTERNNGALLYVLLSERRIEVIVDRGIAATVHPHTLAGVCRTVETEFKKERYPEGVRSGIDALTELLRKHFPPRPGAGNELSDKTVVL
jgi:uncharacterized membrane protein